MHSIWQISFIKNGFHFNGTENIDEKKWNFWNDELIELIGQKRTGSTEMPL